MLGGVLINSTGNVTFNGAVVSRSEVIVYGALSLVINHDDRLTAGGGAETFGLYLPLTWKKIEVVEWRMT